MTVPKQLLVRARKARNNVTVLPHGTSLLDIRSKLPDSPSSLSFSSRQQSPCANRIRLMWQDMRTVVIKHFPTPPQQTIDTVAYLKHIEDIHVTDAYHSLSIEGYRVTAELIERVRAGDWNPEQNADDEERLNALAARGYWQSYQAVRQSIKLILEGHNAGEVVNNHHRIWYREMFAPGVTAGIPKPSDLAGYRNAPVFIRRSMHTPPSKEAVREAMPAFFELLQREKNAAVRVVLGHFIFVFIHPYMDGNGRMGRFLMNTMLASGGYPWTIVPLEKRSQYMAALEEASINQNIEVLASFLGSLVHAAQDGMANN